MSAWAEEAEKGESSQGQHEESPLEAPVASNDGVDDMEIDSEGDYVYDTYVRHLVAADTEMEVMGEGAVGHLIIPDEDQDLWEAYIEDEGDSDKEFDTDDEDSNGSFCPLPQCSHSFHSSQTDNTPITSGRLLWCRLSRR
jgi:hypothetical protein